MAGVAGLCLGFIGFGALGLGYSAVPTTSTMFSDFKEASEPLSIAVQAFVLSPRPTPKP